MTIFWKKIIFKGLPVLHDAKALESMYEAMKSILNQAALFHERFVDNQNERVSYRKLSLNVKITVF